MFRYEYPIFEHKNLLKKTMLDELRDYPISLCRMLLGGSGNGILAGCGLSWERGVLTVRSGLICYGGNIYRMEKGYALECEATDRLVYIKVIFTAMHSGRDGMSGLGKIVLSAEEPRDGELELGRFRLQEGAKLRTEYENFEDYQTEFDTVNRIHAPYIQSDGAGLWPKILTAYASELLESGTEDVYDISFAMQILGTGGHVSPELTRRYAENARENKRKEGEISNLTIYENLLSILKKRRAGGKEQKQQGDGTRQMILL